MSERPERRSNSGWVAWIAVLLGAGTIVWHVLFSGHSPPSTIDGAAIESRLEGLDTTVQRVEQQVAGATTEVARLGDGLAATGRRVEGVEAGTTPAMRQLGESVSGLASRLSALEGQASSRSAAAAGTLADVATRLAALESRQAATAASAPGATVAGEVAALTGPLQKRLESVESARAAERTTLTAQIAGEVAALTGPLQKRLESSESARAAERTTLTAQIAGLAERVDSTVSKAVTDDAKLTEAVIEIGRKLTALEARFSTPDRAHAELLKTIERLESQIADLKSQSLRNAAELGRIYFSFNSWELTAPERRKLQSLVEQSTMQGKVISLIGFADRTGSDDYNQLLSTRRVAVVRDALLKMGVPAALISTASGLGAMGAPVPTAHGVPEAQNRVVYVFGTR